MQGCASDSGFPITLALRACCQPCQVPCTDHAPLRCEHYSCLVATQHMMCRVMMTAVTCWLCLASGNGYQQGGLCASICMWCKSLCTHAPSPRAALFICWAFNGCQARQFMSSEVVWVCVVIGLCIGSARGSFPCGLCPVAAAWLGLGAHLRRTCPQSDGDAAINCFQGSARPWLSPPFWHCCYYLAEHVPLVMCCYYIQGSPCCGHVATHVECLSSPFEVSPSCVVCGLLLSFG